mgnify:CR=1 FL=1
MTLILILFLAGIILLAADIFVTGMALSLAGGAAMLAAPFFGSGNVPAQVRVIATGAVAVLVCAWTPLAAPPALLSLQGIMIVLGEMLVGLSLGFVLQLAFAAPTLLWSPPSVHPPVVRDNPEVHVRYFRDWLVGLMPSLASPTRNMENSGTLRSASSSRVERSSTSGANRVTEKAASAAAGGSRAAVTTTSETCAGGAGGWAS